MLATHPFQYVQEWDDDFLALFPHRYDYIWSERPQPGEKPVWKTEKRHPLSDRLIHQGKYLYGVRFGQTTQYLLIDIDAKSAYHPKQDRHASSRLLAVLESLGLVAHVACTSSYSSGIHLYFPFEQAQNSYQLADAVTVVLENAGFTITPGQLEIFPNVKLYVTEGEPSLFNAHRLPLQEPGAYLLNQEWQPIYTSQSEWVHRWQFAQTRNTLDRIVLSRILKTQKRRHYRLSTRASKFLADLDTEIEAGWTGPGQTNYILGRIAMREYIFHHLIHGGAPLEGQALAEAIATIAQSLPGFKDWCRHQSDIAQRASEWARSAESSHYYHYGYESRQGCDSRQQSDATSPTWNQRQSDAARERIRQAISNLLQQDLLPAGITARRHALTQFGISHSTLSKHKDLWHPQVWAESEQLQNQAPKTAQNQEQTNQLHPERDNAGSTNPPNALENKELHPTTPNKLLGWLCSGAYQQPEQNAFSEVGGSGGISTGDVQAVSTNSDVSVADVSLIKDVPEASLSIAGCASEASLANVVAATVKVAKDVINRARTTAQKVRADAYLARMKRYLESGDPILVKEAQQYLAARAEPEQLLPSEGEESCGLKENL